MTTSIAQQIAFLDGEYLPLMEAKISPQDRGFLFGDGVYEVIPAYQGKLFEFNAHLERLKNSLNAVSIANPYNDAQWLTMLETLIQKHPWPDQFLYLQVTRGVQMQRDHLPEECLSPTVYAYSNPLKPLKQNIIEEGIKVITLADMRWARCDIKAITLLPNVMMKLAAQQQQAQDAILLDQNGWVTEGTASNVFVIKDQQVFTPPLSQQILPGITRMVIEKILQDHQVELHEKPLSQTDLEQASEIWLTSSTKEALPVTYLNNQAVGTGKPGPVWQLQHNLYQHYKNQICQQPS